MAYKTREEWLKAAIVQLDEVFIKPNQQTLPERLGVSCGFPKSSAKAIGQCWSPEVSEGQTIEMFISPVLSDAVSVLATLLHEMAHAVLGIKVAHKGPFVKLIRSFGLEGKPTATYAKEGTDCYNNLMKISVALGTYPHSAMVPPTKVKSSKPWFLLHVRSKANPDYKFTISPRMIEEFGLPFDHAGGEMEVYNPKEG